MPETKQLTRKQVQRKLQTIINTMDKLSNQLAVLQETCAHPDVTKKYGGSTGNYDPSADSYWIDWHCPDCGKRWTTDQDRDNTLKPGRIVK